MKRKEMLREKCVVRENVIRNVCFYDDKCVESECEKDNFF